MSRIKFRCSSCSKTLAVSESHAGKVATCPQCGTKLRIPELPASGLSPSASSQPPAEPRRPEPPPNPFREDDYDELEEMDSYEGSDSDAGFDDDMGFGPVPDVDSHRGSGGRRESSRAAGRRAGQGTGQASASRSAGPSADTFGKSVVGAIVACMVAAFFCVVWLVVVAVSDMELGILAWGMGAAVGLVGGVIARNPSGLYCGLITCIAVMGVLAAKGVMLALISLATFGVDMIADMQMAMSPRQQQLNHAMADQMLADNQFEGVEKEYAELYVSSFYSGSDDLYDEMSDEMLEVSEQVDQRVQDALSQKTSEEEEQLLAAARGRHPEWIENNDHYLAMLNLLINEEGTLSEELSAQARNELAMLGDDWDSEYYSSIEYDERERRSAELRKLAAERLVGMSDADRDQAVRDLLKQYPAWRPFEDAYSAMVEKLHHEGTLTGPLAEHAEATVAYDMTPDYPDYFEEVSEEDQETRDEELQTLVNERLVTMNAEDREALIADSKSRYPDWYTGDGLFPVEDGMQDALEEMGTDGTFWGNFKVVFGPLDILWLVLCAASAFGTAQKFGVAEA